jgi:solute:Na+ symporter, SSS family
LKGNPADYIIIAAYLIGVAAFGIWTGGKQKSIKDYFLGSKTVPWWAVCFSIVAAETSTLNFYFYSRTGIFNQS